MFNEERQTSKNIFEIRILFKGFILFKFYKGGYLGLIMVDLINESFRWDLGWVNSCKYNIMIGLGFESGLFRIKLNSDMLFGLIWV